MTATFLGNPLISELLADPARFNEQGRAYELLQEYFRGYPVETLRPLLAHDDKLVQRAAIWVVSELGEQGCNLLDDVVPLMDGDDRYIRYHALEIALVCAIGKSVDRFVHVARALQSDDEVIRVLAMRLIANADQSQLEACSRLAEATGCLDETHRRGLEQLSRCSSLNRNDVLSMIIAAHSLIRRYGAIAAKRLFKKFPELIADAAKSSDPDVSRFAKESLKAVGG